MIKTTLHLLIFFTLGNLYAEEGSRYFYTENNEINLGIITQQELDQFLQKRFIMVGKNEVREMKPSGYKVHRYRAIEELHISYETHLLFAPSDTEEYFLAFEKSKSLQAKDISVDSVKLKSMTLPTMKNILSSTNQKDKEFVALSKKVNNVLEYHTPRNEKFNYIKVINTEPETVVIQTGQSPIIFSRNKIYFAYDENDHYKSATFQGAIKIKGKVYLYLKTSDMGPSDQPLLIKFDNDESIDIKLKPYSGEYGHRGC